MKPDELLKHWKKSPSEALRTLILAHDDAAPLLQGLAQLKIAQATEALEKFNAAGKAKDPRLTRVLEQLLTDVPWSSDGSKDLWRQVFKLVTASGDARFKQLRPGFQVRPLMAEWLKSQYAKATANLPAAFDATDDAKWKKLADAAPKKPAPKKDSRDEAALLADVYENPRDDAPRLVLADLLIERGDPRGEFIAMQCGGPRDPKKEKALVKAHGKKWLGPLASVLTVDVEFRRGFPAVGTAKFKAQRDVEKFGQAPEWATFEELDWSFPGAASLDQRRWIAHVAPSMRWLKRAHGPFLPLLLAAKEPWLFESLATWLAEPANAKALAETTLFPHLKTLELTGIPEARWFQGVKRLAGAKTLVIPERSNVQEWLHVAEATDLEAFHVGTTQRYSRGSDGAFTRLTFVRDPKQGRYLNGLSESVPEGWVESLELTGEGTLDPAYEAKLLAKVRRKGTPKKAAPAPDALPAFKGATPLDWLDEKQLVIASDKTLFVVDASTKKVTRQFPTEQLHAMRVIEGGKAVVTAGYNTVRVVELATGTERFALPQKWTSHGQLELSADGRFASRGNAGVFDLQKGVVVPPPRGAKDCVRAPDDSFFLKHQPGKPYEVRRVGEKKGVELEGGDWFSGWTVWDGALFGLAREKLIRWNLTTGKREAVLAIGPHSIGPRAGPGPIVSTKASNTSVAVARASDLHQLALVNTGGGDVLGFALSPNGKRLAAVTRDGGLSLYDVK